MRRFSMILFSCLLVSCGSEDGTKATETAEACADSNVLAQCPPNTQGVLEAEATSNCDSNGSLDVEFNGETMDGSGSGAVSQVCVGSGSCRVVCTLLEACDYGVASVSPTDGVVCRPEPTCGNGICDGGEDPAACPQDCGTACGNDVCEGDENADSCPQDCLSACGNGACDSGENPENCPRDCQTACGNGECENGENPENCPNDCSDSVCTDGATRCAGNDLERCNQQGAWETTECPNDQICNETDGVASCAEQGLDCVGICSTLVTNCIENSGICDEDEALDRSIYDRFCADRCATHCTTRRGSWHQTIAMLLSAPAR